VSSEDTVHAWREKDNPKTTDMPPVQNIKLNEPKRAYVIAVRNAND
jgi:hypothetical protein